MKKVKNSQRRRCILTELEQKLYYQRPIFDDEDRNIFFRLIDEEFDLIKNKPTLLAAYAILQLGYLKAKRKFFKASYQEVQHDLQWIHCNYFAHDAIPMKLPPSSTQYYIKNEIAKIMGYETNNILITTYLVEQANYFSRQYNDPVVIFKELFLCLKQKKMLLPGYTSMQDIISQATYQEEERLLNFISQRITDPIKNQFNTLLTNKEKSNTILDIKKDLSGFNYKAMKQEIAIHQSSKDIYQFAKTILPDLCISEQNIQYYAESVIYYSTYELNKLPKMMSYLYLLCFIYYRHQKTNDNLIQAFIYHVDKIKKAAGAHASTTFSKDQKILLSDPKSIGLLIGNYANDKLLKLGRSFKSVAKEAYSTILPKEKIAELSQKMINQSGYQDELVWQYYYDHRQLMELNIRQIFRALTFQADKENHALLEAIAFLKAIFDRGTPISKVPSSTFPQRIIQKKLKNIIIDAKGKIKPYQYEFFVYSKIKDYMIKNVIYINDSVQYKSFNEELKSGSLHGETREEFLKKINKPKLLMPVKDRLAELLRDVEDLFIEVNENIANGRNDSIRVKTEKNGEKTWTLKYPPAEKEFNHRFYDKLPIVSISDGFDFVNEQCNFIRALKHFRIKNVKGEMDYQAIKGGIIAEGTRQSISEMASRCNLDLGTLLRNKKNNIRENTIRAACKIVIKKMCQLPVAKDYMINGKHFCGIDGSKKGTTRKNAKARRSPKYFGLSIGLSVMGMLMDNMIVNSDVISCNEYEAHHLYDLYFNHDAEFSPDVLTMDTHGSNGCNFPLFDAIDIEVYICYRNIFERAKQICGSNEMEFYKDMLIKPKKKFDVDLIIKQGSKITDLFISILSKTTKQSTLTKKLCNHGRQTVFKKAVWEYNNVFFTKFLLTYINNPTLQKHVRRSLNRTESSNKFYNTIVKIGGKKFKGKSEVDIGIENQCTRLLMLIITYYNMYILSEAIKFKKEQNDDDAVRVLTNVSPMATRHFNLAGMYQYEDNAGININDIITALTNALEHLNDKEKKKSKASKNEKNEVDKTEQSHVTAEKIQPDLTKVADFVSNDAIKNDKMNDELEKNTETEITEC